MNGSDLCLSAEPFDLVATVLVIGLCLLGGLRFCLDLAVLGVAGESMELKRRVDLRGGGKDCGVRGIGGAGEDWDWDRRRGFEGVLAGVAAIDEARARVW